MERCQHCEQDIERLPNGYWVDASGFFYCQKQVGDFPALLHKPMPVVR